MLALLASCTFPTTWSLLTLGLHQAAAPHSPSAGSFLLKHISEHRCPCWELCREINYLEWRLLAVCIQHLGLRTLCSCGMEEAGVWEGLPVTGSPSLLGAYTAQPLLSSPGWPGTGPPPVLIDYFFALQIPVTSAGLALTTKFSVTYPGCPCLWGQLSCFVHTGSWAHMCSSYGRIRASWSRAWTLPCLPFLQP